MGKNKHLMELDEAHRLPGGYHADFVIMDDLPLAYRRGVLIPVRETQRLISESIIAEAFRGTIIRYAWQDQHPRFWSKDRLRHAARDSVIRYAMHHGLTIKFTDDQWGQRWTWNGDRREWASSGVHGWSSEAVITGRAVR